MKRLLFTLVFIVPVFTFCHAQYTNLFSFSGTNGSYPSGTLVLTGDKLYGTTQEGGSYNHGCIFSINIDGSGYKDRHDFDTADGKFPPGNLILSGDRLYGVAQYGGLYNNGTIFSIDTDGSGFRVIFNFDNYVTLPNTALILAGNKLYGGCVNGIFSIDTNGTGYKSFLENALNTITDLILSGNTLYGISESGGLHGDGYIFSIDTNGTGYADLLDFNGTNGSKPNGNILLLSGNKLFGTVPKGGAHDSGLIFSINTNGTGYTDFYDFDGIHGGNPQGGLQLAGALLIGTTCWGGANHNGCIFVIDTNGTNYTDLYDLTNSDGARPWNMTLTPFGIVFYGTASYGGTGYGTIFSYEYDYLGVPTISANTASVNIYPNPSNGQFTLAVSHAELVSASQPIVEVYNVLGQEVFNATLNPPVGGQGDNTIDLSNQPNGVYLYKVISELGNLIGEGKLVIQR